jgi:hypothetical protein
MKVTNKEEFEDFYPYSKDQISEYPKEYPCIVNWEYEGGGLMGEYKQVYVAYFPKNTTSDEAFRIGLEDNPWTPLK